ncbi:MAG TPA: hypothetical protein VFE32_19075 [Puia sp.]|jgi:antitoxin component YwqK of YwqJK toxin-antitoxin module|nr:hypothetical protein [Puia sp.]
MSTAVSKHLCQLLAISLLSSNQLLSQKPDCNWEIQKTGDGKYLIRVNNYDSLTRGETCFLGWMNTAKDKPDGELVVYDEAGRKRRTAIYQSGARTGRHYEWYKTGELYSITNWETDEYFNDSTFYPSGKLQSTAVNGNRSNALYSEWYENGQVEFVEDDAAHTEKTYFQNGQPKTDRSNGTYTEWYANGRVKLTGHLDSQNQMMRIGKWSYYDEKGKLTRELIYDEKYNASWYGNEKGYKKEIKY